MSDAVDSKLVRKLAKHLTRPPARNRDRDSSSILTVTAASFGLRPIHEELTQPTGFDPKAAELFEVIVEAAYLVLTAAAPFEPSQRESFRKIVLASCNGMVAELQVSELLEGLARRLEHEGLERRVAEVTRAIDARNHAHEVLRVAALIAHASGRVSEREQDVLRQLARGLSLGEADLRHALEQLDEIHADSHR